MDCGKRSLSSSVTTEQSAKKAKNSQKFKDSYSAEFPCLRKYQFSENMAFCTLCSKHFSVMHGGRDDCRRHVSSKKHIECAKSVDKTRNVADFFKTEDLSAIKAECLFSRFLIEHNLPISAADHAKHLFQGMFPDSKIAKQFSCGHTKTNAIIKNMAENTTKELVSSILNDNKPFAISTDGSNDCHDKKLYPLLLTYFDDECDKIVTKLLSLLESSDNTGEGIFNAVFSGLQKKGLQLKNCVSFSSDNANTMLGKKKGVAAFILKENPLIIIRGCPCHLIHIAAKRASSEFDKNIEMLLIDIFYFLDKSSKRKSNFKLEQMLCGKELKPHKILKYTSTRWLSLFTCVDRILEQWEPLKAFFCENVSAEDLKNKRFSCVKLALEDPSIKLYLLFLQSALPVFTKVNVILQQDAPYIHKLRRVLIQLYMELLVRFVKPDIVSDSDVKLNLANKSFLKRSKQKEDEALVIGVKTRMYLNNASLITETEIRKFYSSVRKFYSESCSYILEKILVHDDFLIHAEVADISIRTKVDFSSVLYMVKRFPFITTESDLESLEIEFAKYQSENLQTIESVDRIDLAWAEISKLKDCTGGIKYKFLPKVMFSILIVPHSNAASERIFSIIRKNQTDFRPNLSIDTLEALLVQKVNMLSCKQVCYQKTFTESELKSAKKCTSNLLCGVKV